MRVSVRFAVPEDVPICVAMGPFAFGRSDAEQQRIASWLHQLLLQGRALCAVVVNESDKLLGFGLSLFISDRFREYLLSARFIRLLGRELEYYAHSHSVLDRRAILRQHCRDGLNLVGFYGWRNDLPNEQIETVKTRLYRSFAYLHYGYHLKSFLKEVYGEHERSFYTAIGCSVYRTPIDYRQADQPFQPYLIGQTRDEACFPYRIADIFQFGPPPVNLTERQRTIGQMAYLMRMDDQQIADCLGVSTGTIYNAWYRLRRKLDHIIEVDNGQRGRSNCLQIMAYRRELIYPLCLHTLFYHKPNLARHFQIPLI